PPHCLLGVLLPYLCDLSPFRTAPEGGSGESLLGRSCVCLDPPPVLLMFPPDLFRIREEGGIALGETPQAGVRVHVPARVGLGAELFLPAVLLPQDDAWEGLRDGPFNKATDGAALRAGRDLGRVAQARGEANGHDGAALTVASRGPAPAGAWWHSLLLVV